jgi:protein-arginine kinase
MEKAVIVDEENVEKAPVEEVVLTEAQARKRLKAKSKKDLINLVLKSWVVIDELKKINREDK